jgi:hypothetical protein
MSSRTTTTTDRGDHRAAPAIRSRRRPPSAPRRPGLYLGVAAAGAVLVNVLAGAGPVAQAEAGTSESVSVARQLGLTAQSRPADAAADLEPLEDLVVSRSTREAEQSAAQQSQDAADRAERSRLDAEAEAAAKAKADAEAAAKAAAKAAAAAAAAAQQQAAASPAPSPGIAATTIAHISNSYGDVKPQVQAAADSVVSNVPGAAGITLGGTRASATDPHGHPSGLALDYMVLSDAALGDAIVDYHRAHWNELGVEYLIWQQRMLSSPDGSWEAMSDRGSATANHMDHVHVNYLG